MSDAIARTLSDLAVALLFAAVAAGCAPSEHPRGGVAPTAEDPSGAADLPVATADWSAGAEAGIAAGQYAPQADGASFRVHNLAKDLRGVFSESGLAVTDLAGAGEVGRDDPKPS